MNNNSDGFVATAPPFAMKLYPGTTDPMNDALFRYIVETVTSDHDKSIELTVLDNRQFLLRYYRVKETPLGNSPVFGHWSGRTLHYIRNDNNDVLLAEVPTEAMMTRVSTHAFSQDKFFVTHMRRFDGKHPCGELFEDYITHVNNRLAEAGDVVSDGQRRYRRRLLMEYIFSKQPQAQMTDVELLELCHGAVQVVFNPNDVSMVNVVRHTF